MQNNQDPKINICAVVLAAGKSSRMGKFKPLLEIDGVPAVKRLIHSIRNSFIDDVIVVTGHNHGELERTLVDVHAITVYNADYEQGMFTSIQTGIKKARSLRKYDGVMLFLVDVPLIPSGVIISLSMIGGDSKDHFIVPTYEGKKGHPLFIPQLYFDEILNHDGTNGLKGITNKYDDRMIRIETDEEAVVLDMDNPEDYQEIRAYFDKSKSPRLKKNILDETGFNETLYLVRHGSTALHKEKIYMGQVDVPLSEEGREQVQITAGDLAGIKPKTDIIYTSPLLRTRESAEIIRKRFMLDGDEKHIIENDAFMEMSLGDWDGRYISEIKEKYPDEYEKRGKNILTYKRDPDGENHYDLKYRVLKELKKIMKNTDPGKDILLVTHKGVINVIRESILSLDSLTARDYNPPKGSLTIMDGGIVR